MNYSDSLKSASKDIRNKLKELDNWLAGFLGVKGYVVVTDVREGRRGLLIVDADDGKIYGSLNQHFGIKVLTIEKHGFEDTVKAGIICALQQHLNRATFKIYSPYIN